MRVQRSAPILIVDYNRFMGGTDLCDQRRGNFSTQRKSKKWWHALFYFTLDVLMVCGLFVSFAIEHRSTHTHTRVRIHSLIHSLSHTHSCSSTVGLSTIGRTRQR